MYLSMKSGTIWRRLCRFLRRSPVTALITRAASLPDGPFERNRHMSRFLLLLRDDPSTFSSLSPEKMQAIIQKYVAWGNRLRGCADGGDARLRRPGWLRRLDGLVSLPHGLISNRRRLTRPADRLNTASWGVRRDQYIGVNADLYIPECYYGKNRADLL